jgi:cleavage stimulation factor subunit 3
MDEEAEAAFFQAQQSEAMTESAPAELQEGDNSDSDDYDPSQTLGDDYPIATPDLNPAHDTPADATPTDDNAPNPTDTTDMDARQLADALDPSQNPSRAESQTSTPVPPSGNVAEPQTTTIGGFEVDNDEDDKGDADYEPPAVLGDENANDMTVPEDLSSGNAIQNTSPDVSSQAAQGPISGPDLNSSYSPAPVHNIDPSFASGQPHWAAQDVQSAHMQTSTDPTPVPDSLSVNGRLPHDRVGILEDRIKEDPRGDIPAWLELIAEHRSRNRLDSARETYERFLKVFPQAVSLPSPSSKQKLLI